MLLFRVCMKEEFLSLEKEFLSEFAQKHPFDFIIASSHLCNGGDPYYPDFFEARSEEAVYEEYHQNR